MKTYKILIALMLFGLMLMTACGQIYGNSPLGATGGGENGYGILDNQSSYDDYFLANIARPEVQEMQTANPTE